MLFPGVCGSRHSKENAVGWVPAALAALDLPKEVRRVGVAHGSLEGLSPDFGGDYFPMTCKELESSGMDVWLLGHTHVRYPDRDRLDGDRILFPATPEPDGFDCRHAGHAWIVEVSANGKVTGESVRTGRYRFRSIEMALTGEPDLDRLRSDFAALSSGEDLVKLTLSGRLPGELYEARGELLDTLRKTFLYLEDDLSGLIREIKSADIGREFTEGSFPFRLLAELADQSGDPEALQIAWDLVREARS